MKMRNILSLFLLIVNFFTYGQTLVSLVRIDSTWHCINKDGIKLIINLGTSTNHFSNGLLRVKDKGNNKFGFKDAHGNWVIKPIYEKAEDFSEGLAAVRISGYWGFINKKGEIVIEPNFDDARNFSNGMAGVKVLKEWGFIDTKGNKVIETKYELIKDFSIEGLASVQADDGIWKVIRKDGSNYLSTSKNVRFIGQFYNGAARVCYGSEKNGTIRNWGFIDSLGKVIFKFTLENAEDFHDGLARVREYGKWGFINTKGEYVVQPIYGYAFDFVDGLAIVRYKGKYGVINTKGEWVLEPKFNSLSDYKNGYISARDKFKWGFIDVNGNWIIQPQFNEVKIFELAD